LAEDGRTIEDRLREEYFQLLPEIRRVAGQLESQINYHLLPIANALEPHEQLIVKSRIKECESAVDALRRRIQEGGIFRSWTADHVKDDEDQVLALKYYGYSEVSNRIRGDIRSFRC
jgi:hypothetical protein